MVLITNISDRPLFRRLPNGQRIDFDAGEPKEVKSKRLTEALGLQASAFRVEKSHLIPPKTNRRQNREERIPSEHSDNVDDPPTRKGRKGDWCGTGRDKFKGIGKPKQDSEDSESKSKGLKDNFGKPQQDSKPKGLRLPKSYYKLGLKKGWRKFKEDRAKAEVID